MAKKTYIAQSRIHGAEASKKKDGSLVEHVIEPGQEYVADEAAVAELVACGALVERPKAEKPADE